MKISELLSRCEIKQGWTKNERLYVYNGDEVLSYATRTKNAWLNNCIKNYSTLSEDEIEQEVTEYLGAKKALFSDMTDIKQELDDKIAEAIRVFKNSTTNELPTIETLSQFLPEPAIDVIKKHYN